MTQLPAGAVVVVSAPVHVGISIYAAGARADGAVAATAAAAAEVVPVTAAAVVVVAVVAAGGNRGGLGGGVVGIGAGGRVAFTVATTAITSDNFVACAVSRRRFT